MPKAKNIKTKRPCALEKQLAYDARPYFKPVKETTLSDNENEKEGVMSASLSRKTMQLAREQQQEEEKENDLTFENTQGDDDDSDDSEMDDNDDAITNQDHDGYVEEVHVSAADEETMESFMEGNFSDRRNLGDIILEKIREKEAAERGETTSSAAPELNPKVIEVYNGVGRLLKRYTSGKLPKAFKVIPSLSNWEEILWLTHPEEWSPHAMGAATRLFASNLNPKMAQRFFNIFLLEHVRQDIRDNKKLHFHLYMALKKSLYKPQAFFKGIVLPLCEGKDCTLREATIIGSVLSKVSVPVIHSAAALMKLTEFPYSGATSLFVTLLLQKKYSLPTRVIAALGAHFVTFTKETRALPVLWHQALLVFAQRYKNHISQPIKESMKGLLKQHFHHQITPEIRRELFTQ